MLLTAAPLAVLVLLFLLLPGILWAWRCYPAAHWAERLAVGMGLGAAWQMHLGALLAATVKIDARSVALTTAASIFLSGMVARSGRMARGHDSRRTSLIVLLLAGLALRLAPLAWQQVPPGWDPSFHCLLASTTVQQGRLPTWQPYEPIPSHYPYGSHVLLADMSLLTGERPHRMFGPLLNGVVAFATLLAMYALGRRLWRQHGPALAVCLAYGLLADGGSLDYGGWGGLPNALGMFLMLGFLCTLFAPAFGRLRVVVGGILLGAVPLAHHHAALTAALLLLAYLGYLSVEPRARHLRSRLLRAMAVALAVSSYYSVPMLLHVGDLPRTASLQTADKLSVSPIVFNGWALWLLALFGWRWRSRGRADVAALVWGGAAMLAVVFAADYYGYGVWTDHQHHQDAFTATRFLTDLTYFLALMAGPPLLWLWRRDRMCRGLVAVCVVSLPLYYLLPQLGLQPSERTPQPGELEALTWIRDHTPSDTLVLNPSSSWAPYLTARESSWTPLPLSEPVRDVEEKRYLANLLVGVLALAPTQQPLVFTGFGSALPRLLKRPVAVLIDQDLHGAGTASWRGGCERVYLLADGFDRLGARSAVVEWQTPRLLHVRAPLTWSALRVSCRAENRAAMAVNGVDDADLCNGEWRSLRSHDISVRLPPQEPWFYLMLLAAR